MTRNAARICCLAALLAAAASTAAAEYRTAEVESLKITIDSDWGTRLAPGYLPVRFDIVNLGEARVIEIVSEGMRFSRMMRSSGPAQTSARQALRLGRGDRVRVTLPIPVFADSENVSFQIVEGGRTLERFNYMGVQSATPAINASALIVAQRDSPFGQISASLPRTASGPSYTGGAVVFSGPAGARTATRAIGPALDFVLEPSRLPNTWLGYTALRAVVIGAGEWGQLDDLQRGALLTWTACGGDLIVADGESTELAGGGHRVAPAAPGEAVHAYFFGRIHRRSSASIADMGLAPLLVEATRLQDSDWSLPANRVRDWGLIAGRGFRVPIPGVAGVPARAYVGILVVFSLLIGPVNYWLLWRKKRQVLFVLTAPIVSAIFILLLGGYVLAGEGLRISGRAETFTMLDQARRQAVTRASASFYAAGMTPGGGMRFPRDVAVYAIGPDGQGSRDTQTLDLTESQRFASGVMRARAPSNIEEIGFRSARERVSVTPSAGGFTVVNGLGARIERLMLRSGGKLYSTTGPIAAGATATLTAGTIDPRTFVPADLPLAARFLHLAANQPEGSYLAVLDRSPFWEPGLTNLAERGSFHFLIGWPGGQP